MPSISTTTLLIMPCSVAPNSIHAAFHPRCPLGSSFFAMSGSAPLDTTWVPDSI